MINWFKGLYYRQRANRYGVPYELKDLWLPYHISFKHPIYGYPELECTTDLYSEYYKHGIIICPVFRSEITVMNMCWVYYYEVINWWRSSGDDHAVSPLNFHVQFRYAKLEEHSGHDQQRRIQRSNTRQDP